MTFSWNREIPEYDRKKGIGMEKVINGYKKNIRSQARTLSKVYSPEDMHSLNSYLLSRIPPIIGNSHWFQTIKISVSLVSRPRLATELWGLEGGGVASALAYRYNSDSRTEDSKNILKNLRTVSIIMEKLSIKLEDVPLELGEHGTFKMIADWRLENGK